MITRRFPWLAAGLALCALSQVPAGSGVTPPPDQVPIQKQITVLTPRSRKFVRMSKKGKVRK